MSGLHRTRGDYPYRAFYFMDFSNRRSDLEVLHDILQYLKIERDSVKTRVTNIIGTSYPRYQQYHKLLLEHGLIEETQKYVERGDPRGSSPRKLMKKAGTKVMKISITEKGKKWLEEFDRIATPFYNYKEE